MKFDITPIQLIDKNINNIYMKRDDLLPFSFGGNKVRIAYEYIEDLKNNGYTCMIAYGNSRSNLCRVLSNLCYINNIDCYVLSPIEDGEEYIETCNSIIVKKLAKQIITCSKSEVPVQIENLINNLKSRGEKPYYIYEEDKIMCAIDAYVKTYEEIKLYEIMNNIYFDYIFLASGTGATQSGLICGKIKNKDENRKIVGISVARNTKRGKEVIDKNIKLYINNDNIDISTMYEFVDDYILEGYGKYSKQIQITIKEMLFKNGIALDLTYTGKAYWGMSEYIKKNRINGKNILFIHTGGTPLFFDNIKKIIE